MIPQLQTLFENVEAITFDCYGTLIDWETGLLRDLRASLDLAHHVTDEQLLASYAEAEAGVEAGPFLIYKDVLRASLARVAAHLGGRVSDPAGLVTGLVRWEPFHDTCDALRALKKRYKLCIVSNVDRDLFDATARRLEVPFDVVVTAGDVRSYKPGNAHFHEAARRLQIPFSNILHAAQSLYHDIAPASRLGMRTAWIDRRAGRRGGATPDAGPATPDATFSTLAQFAQLATQQSSNR